jgi:hypothetical protein
VQQGFRGPILYSGDAECSPQGMTLHELRATLPSVPETVFPSNHSFFLDPLYWPAVCSFASAAISDFFRLVLLQRKYAYYSFSSMYFVEVTVCRRPSGSVLLVFSSGIRHVMLTAILTGDECQSLYLSSFKPCRSNNVFT